MEQPALTPEQTAQVNALAAGLTEQVERVGVDLNAVGPHVTERHTRTERWISDDETEVTHAFSMDVSRVVETLRRLPDNAGTQAFLAVYSKSTASQAPDTRSS